MARYKNEVIQKAEAMLEEGYDIDYVAKKTGMSEKSVQKLNEAIADQETEDEIEVETEEEELEGNPEDTIEHWKKVANFWKAKYLEAWVDLVELGID